MTQNAEPEPMRFASAPERLADEPLDGPDITQLAETTQNEYELTAEDRDAEQPSIDDALETDRVIDEGAESRNTDGYRFDETRERGTDEAVAAEQGNRDEDRMEVDIASEELDEIARGDDPVL